MDPISLFSLASRGVNIVTAPTHLALEEVTSAQNAECVSDRGEEAVDQRPGMSKVNSVTLAGGSVLFAQDIPAEMLYDKTPTLYAGFYTGSTHNWRTTTDGTTWANADTPAKPFSASVNIAGFFRNFPKCATIGKKMYYVDASTPIGLHQWDGTTDSTISTIPPAVSGSVIATPTVYPTDLGGWFAGRNGDSNGVTYTYKFVAVAGAAHSAASAAETDTNGPTTLNNSGGAGTGYFSINSVSNPPPAGATAVDVYRTAGGATQGKIGSIPIVAGVYTTNNGSSIGLGSMFYDAGLVGDASTPPVAASGSTAGDALGVFDLITDGSQLYLAVFDAAPGDPSIYGRVLQFNPSTNLWMQIGASFPTASGNGTPSALVSYDGAFTYGTYIGTTSGNTSYVTGLATPLPAGGIPEVHTTAVSQATCAIAMFNGSLFVGYVSLVAATAAIVAKRVAGATWSTSLTGPATAQYNAFTSLGVFNGSLFAGWTSGGGATAANIKSTVDGTNWTAEITLGVGEVPCQMIVFNSKLYVVCGRTGVGYNTTSRILQRDTVGTWTAVDDPADDLAGCISVVYV